MKLDDIIKTICPDTPYIYKDSEKGLTNRNLICICDKQKYMIRLPHEDASSIVNRTHESAVLKQIKDSNLDVEEVYYDETSGIRITKYVDDLYEYEECPYPDKIERTAKLMRRLHDLNAHTGFSFDPIARLQQYQNSIQHPLFELSDYETILASIEAMNHPSILCHNDWVSGNILFSETRDYLIDYEYGADNDPLFDIMSFFTENQIVDERERERFYKIYFHELEVPYDDLKVWECFHNLLWCNWAMMLYESRHEEIYKEIAEWKYQAYKKNRR